MMAIVELALWIIATPFLLFVGFAWLGFILGLISDPVYRVSEATANREKSNKS